MDEPHSTPHVYYENSRVPIDIGTLLLIAHSSFILCIIDVHEKVL